MFSICLLMTQSPVTNITDEKKQNLICTINGNDDHSTFEPLVSSYLY